MKVSDRLFDSNTVLHMPCYAMHCGPLYIMIVAYKTINKFI